MEKNDRYYDLDLLKCDLSAPASVRTDVDRGYTFLKLDKKEEAKAVFEQISNQHPGLCCGWFGLAAVATNNFTPASYFQIEKVRRVAAELLNTAKKVAPENVVPMIDAFYREYEEKCVEVFISQTHARIKELHGDMLTLKAEFERISDVDAEHYDEYEVYQIAQYIKKINLKSYFKSDDRFPVFGSFWYRFWQAILKKTEEYDSLNTKAFNAQGEWHYYVYERSRAEAHAYWCRLDDPHFTELEKYDDLVKTRLSIRPKQTDYQIITWELPNPAVISVSGSTDAEQFSAEEEESLRYLAEIAAILRQRLDDSVLSRLPAAAKEGYLRIQQEANAVDSVYKQKQDRAMEAYDKQEKKKKSRKRFKKILIAVLLLGPIVGYVLFQFIRPDLLIQYKQAKELMENHEYAEAAAIFSELSVREVELLFTRYDKPIRDSAELRIQCEKLALQYAEIGDSVILGRQYNAKEWTVLDKQDGKLLLITKYGLYYTWSSGNSWEESDLREALNGSFYRYFSETEKQWICLTENTTLPNPISGTDSGGPTEDYIFILSYYEALEYFPDNDSRIAYDASNHEKTVSWYLRTMAQDKYHICAVYTNGEVDCGEEGKGHSYEDKTYTRPVMWVSVPN